MGLSGWPSCQVCNYLSLLIITCIGSPSRDCRGIEICITGGYHVTVDASLLVASVIDQQITVSKCSMSDTCDCFGVCRLPVAQWNMAVEDKGNRNRVWCI